MKTFEEAAAEASREVQAERVRQEKEWGEQNHDPFTWLAILGEEVGEASQQALWARFHKESPPGAGSADEFKALCMVRFEKEMVQVAAVAQAIVECMKRDKWSWPVVKPEKKPNTAKAAGVRRVKR